MVRRSIKVGMLVRLFSHGTDAPFASVKQVGSAVDCELLHGPLGGVVN